MRAIEEGSGGIDLVELEKELEKASHEEREPRASDTNVDSYDEW